MINRTGDYTFKLCSDDGSRLTINQIPVVGNWGIHGMKCVEDIRQWSAGWHDLQVQHFANEGGAMLTLQYKGYDTQDKFVNVSAYRVPAAAGAAAGGAAAAAGTLAVLIPASGAGIQMAMP